MCALVADCTLTEGYCSFYDGRQKMHERELRCDGDIRDLPRLEAKMITCLIKNEAYPSHRLRTLPRKLSQEPISCRQH